MKFTILFLFSLLLASCGNEVIRPIYQNNFSAASGETVNCPHYLKNIEYCFDVDWIEGPQFGKKNNIRIQFWEKSEAEERNPKLSTPTGDIKIKVHMACCHSPASSQTVKKSKEGSFLLKDIVLGEGEWYTKVQITQKKDGKEVVLDTLKTKPVKVSVD